MNVGDLVWCQNGIRKNMGIIAEITTRARDPKDDYCWVVLIEGSSRGQEKWTQLKDLILVTANEK